MGLPPFDTHAYVKRLKQAGFNEEQAEAQAELQAQVLSSLVTEKLATKDDIARLETVTKEDILRLENSTKEDILRLEVVNKEQIARFTGKLNQLNWMVGFLLAGVVSTLFKLFLHS